MTKKKNTAIVKEMSWPTADNSSASRSKNAHAHFTLIDARELFCKGRNEPDASKLILKIIYMNKNSNQSNKNNN